MLPCPWQKASRWVATVKTPWQQRRMSIHPASKRNLSCAMNKPEDTWYEDAMTAREDVFASAFGPASPSGKVFSPNNAQLFLAIPGFAFLRYPPTPTRPFWLYLTHGLSQPENYAEFEASIKGTSARRLRIEFGIATSQEESWPFQLLEMLSTYVLKSGTLILPSDRIPSSGLMKQDKGDHLLALNNPGYKTDMSTILGHAIHIVHLVGTTAEEIAKAKEQTEISGSLVLEKALKSFGIGCVTDRKRESITLRTDFPKIWKKCTAEARDEENNCFQEYVS